jgi:hypothetical protein
MSFEPMLILIIFVVVVIVLLILYQQIFAVSKTEFDVKECQASLLLTRAVDTAQTNTVSCMFKTDNPAPIKCDRQFITIGDETIMQDGKEVTGLYSKACDGEPGCMAKRVVAERMAKCWEQFFNGEQVVLQQVEGSAWSLFNTGALASSCFVCAELSYEGTGTITSEDFTTYLKETSYKDGTYYSHLAENKKAWCDTVYMEQLGADTCWDVVREGNGLATPITKGSYAVVYMRRGMGACEESGASGVTVSYGDAGPKVQTQTLTNTVQFMPIDKVPTACKVVLV